MKYESLNGKNIKSDISLILDTIKTNSDLDTIFVFEGNLNGGYPLYDYIDFLAKGGIDDETICKLKICYEKLGLNLSVNQENGGTKKLDSMSKLIDFLNKENNARIVVDNDSREDLAFIVQQLIYIQYPLEKIDILLRKEEQDAEKVKRFMNEINALVKGCNTGYYKLVQLRKYAEQEKDEKLKEDCLKDIDSAIDSCQLIGKNLEKAKKVDLKIAVTASKKTGKSVMVNCFIGEEIAPTSIQLATPNNCVYRASRDGKYHLEHEGKNDDRAFDSREAIYDAINEEFREAQNNAKDDYKAVDMNIDYVTEKNNFSSYTIFDTPGPDAAGTGHKIAAKNALEKCDVAIFAIDYSKYLTESEKQYLDEEVKRTFEEQNKFHTLMFALNKMDVRYNDAKCKKSVVKAVDFVRTRLAELGKNGKDGEKDEKAYRDCIIFPTCSLEYFYAIDAEKSGADELKYETDIYEMGKIKKIHKNIEGLQWLYKHSIDLETYHGFETISYDKFKEDSGMPALMKYASYIAQSKARDEIVNSLAFQIENQRNKLQGIIAYISNLEKFINMDEEKIAKISKIIKDYEDNTVKLLKQEFDRNDLNKLSSDALLRLYNGDYEEIQKSLGKTINDSISERIADEFYERFISEAYAKIEKCEKFNQNSLNELFKEKDFEAILSGILRSKAKSIIEQAEAVTKKVGDEVAVIINNRLNLLNELGKKCQAELEKQDVYLDFPEISSFQPAIPTPSVSEFRPDIYVNNLNVTNNLNANIEVDKFSSVTSFLGNNKANIALGFLDYLVDPLFIGTGYSLGKLYESLCSGEHKILVKPENFYKFRELCDKIQLKRTCTAIINSENKVPEIFRKLLTDKLEFGYMRENFASIDDKFNEMNDSYMNSVAKFSEAVDDREKYKENIKKFTKHKEIIDSIMASTSDFMAVWKEVIGGVTSTK